MWTKDYLVRGSPLGRRQRLARWGWYGKRSWLKGDRRWTPEDEWQALYRVEDARRKLKQARAKLEEDRRIILAWDVIELRKRIEAAEQAAALARNAAEQERLKEVQKERWKKEAEKISAEARGHLTPDRVWMAWAWANGQKQIEIARQLGYGNSTTVSVACRQYVIAHYPENLYRHAAFAYGVDHRGDRHTLIKLALAGKPEPPRPAAWRAVERPSLGLPDEVPKGPQAPTSAAEWRETGDRRIRWVLQQRRAGFTLRQIAEAMGLGPERIRQMQKKAERREARAAETVWLWYETRATQGLGRPLDIDANREDYRGKWLYE